MSNKLFPLKVRGKRKPSFTEECHLIFVERRTELKNQHIINTKTITDSGKNYQWMQKPPDKRVQGIGYLLSILK